MAVKKGIEVVTAEWLRASRKKGLWLREHDYRPPPFQGLVIVATGFQREERDELWRLCEAHGGTFMKDFDRKTCSCLLATEVAALSQRVSSKVVEALSANVPVLSKQWLLTCAHDRLRHPCEAYDVADVQANEAHEWARRGALCSGGARSGGASGGASSGARWGDVPDSACLAGCVIAFVGFGADDEKAARALVRKGMGTVSALGWEADSELTHLVVHGDAKGTEKGKLSWDAWRKVVASKRSRGVQVVSRNWLLRSCDFPTGNGDGRRGADPTTRSSPGQEPSQRALAAAAAEAEPLPSADFEYRLPPSATSSALPLFSTDSKATTVSLSSFVAKIKGNGFKFSSASTNPAKRKAADGGGGGGGGGAGISGGEDGGGSHAASQQRGSTQSSVLSPQSHKVVTVARGSSVARSSSSSSSSSSFLAGYVFYLDAQGPALGPATTPSHGPHSPLDRGQLDQGAKRLRHLVLAVERHGGTAHITAHDPTALAAPAHDDDDDDDDDDAAPAAVVSATPSSSQASSQASTVVARAPAGNSSGETPTTGDLGKRTARRPVFLVTDSGPHAAAWVQHATAAAAASSPSQRCEAATFLWLVCCLSAGGMALPKSYPTLFAPMPWALCPFPNHDPHGASREPFRSTRPPSFTLCFSGFESYERTGLWHLAKLLGGHPTTTLSCVNTHLVAARPKGDKYDRAVEKSAEWNLAVVTKHWLLHVARHGYTARSEAQFPLHPLHPLHSDAARIEPAADTAAAASTPQAANASVAGNIAQTADTAAEAAEAPTATTMTHGGIGSAGGGIEVTSVRENGNEIGGGGEEEPELAVEEGNDENEDLAMGYEDEESMPSFFPTTVRRLPRAGGSGGRKRCRVVCVSRADHAARGGGLDDLEEEDHNQYMDTQFCESQVVTYS